MRDDPPGFWGDIGSSDNRVYVTLETPKTKLYQTFVDVGCTKGQGAMDSRTAFEGIWSGFATRVISRYDGVLLTYYNPLLKEYRICNDAEKMIAQLSAPSAIGPYSIGNCIAWADFLHKCLLAQGIDNGKKVTITALKTEDAPRDGFLVKNWTTDINGPYKFKEVGITAVLVVGAGLNVFDQPGIEGQSNADPPANFGNHYIYEFAYVDDIGGIFKYWDPSYGSGPFKDDRDYEDGPNSPIQGFRLKTGDEYKVFLNTAAKELDFAP